MLVAVIPLEVSPAEHGSFVFGSPLCRGRAGESVQ